MVSSQPFNPATHSEVQVSLERGGAASPFRHHLQQRGPALLLISTCTGPAECAEHPRALPSIAALVGTGKF